jgi:hypothetical protein
MDRRDSIPVDCSLPRHRKVLEIARKASVSRREALATLIEFWIWSSRNADAYGNLPRLTLADLTEAVPASAAFWRAVSEAGWLTISENGLSIPKAEKWLNKNSSKRQREGQVKDESPVALAFVVKRMTPLKPGDPDEPVYWNLTSAQVALWQTQFSNVTVLEECKRAQAWTEANGHKTALGMKRFLCSWLDRAHNRSKKESGQKPLISRVPSDDDLKDWRP